MTKRAIGLLLAMVSGCMSETGGTAPVAQVVPVMCPARHGLYGEHFVETNGNCGAIPDLSGNIDAPLAAGCAFSSTATQFNCHVVATTSCAANANGITTNTTLTVTFNADGSVGTGTIYLQLSGATACASTYAVTYTAIK